MKISLEKENTKDLSNLNSITLDSYNYSCGSTGYNSSISWLVKDNIPSHSLGIIYGSSGSFKSFLAIDISCCITSGKRWGENKVDKGSVVYIAAEGQFGLARRVRAWEIANDTTVENLYVIGNSINISDTEDQTRLINTIKEIERSNKTKIKLIVIDTLARCFNGDENTSRDMGKFINGCDKIKEEVEASILCIHHSGKDGDKGARGSSSLKAACDYEYLVKRSKKANTLSLINTKQKDGEEAISLEIELDSIDLGITCDEHKPVTSLARKKPPTISTKNTDSKKCQIYTILEGKMNGSATRKDIRNEIFNKSKDKPSPADRQRFSRAINNLLSNGLIVINSIEPDKTSDMDIISIMP